MPTLQTLEAQGLQNATDIKTLQDRVTALETTTGADSNAQDEVATLQAQVNALESQVQSIVGTTQAAPSAPVNAPNG